MGPTSMSVEWLENPTQMWNMVNPIIIFCKKHQLSLTKN